MSTYPSCKHDFSDPMGVCPLCEQENKIESLERQLAEARAEITRYRSGIEIDGYVRNDCGSHWIESAYLGSDTEFANDMSVRVLIMKLEG